MRVIKQRCIRCQEDEGITALMYREESAEGGGGGGMRCRTERRGCSCEWLSDTCRQAGMSSVCVKMSSWNSLCSLAVLPQTTVMSLQTFTQGRNLNAGLREHVGVTGLFKNAISSFHICCDGSAWLTSIPRSSSP